MAVVPKHSVRSTRSVRSTNLRAGSARCYLCASSRIAQHIGPWLPLSHSTACRPMAGERGLSLHWAGGRGVLQSNARTGRLS